MQEKVKQIISVYLKIPEDQINASTVIDRSAISSSILLHRMYAKLADAGIVVNDYQQVSTVGQLLKQVHTGNADGTASPVFTSAAPAISVAAGGQKEGAGIGIDIEMVNAMPLTNDFREDSFYTMNFSASEIAYAILQTNPYASFAGLFAVKEAIVKADNAYKGTEFKHIPVQHQSNGKPFHPAFNLSISHTNEMAVAVAVPVRNNYDNGSAVPQVSPGRQTSKGSALIWILVLTSLLLSIAAIFLIAGKK